MRNTTSNSKLMDQIDREINEYSRTNIKKIKCSKFVNLFLTFRLCSYISDHLKWIDYKINKYDNIYPKVIYCPIILNFVKKNIIKELI